MSLLARLFGRRDAMDVWSSGLERRTRTPASVEARTPDAEPEDVPYTGRVGFNGQPLKGQTGGITGLESGGSPYVPSYDKN
ncbi:MAG TPA: hypothetical protein VD836_06255 [Solirubrobacteraceae bacterium]|nr:hypothetical protein [Solirubrobacteraceae bacterium]